MTNHNPPCIAMFYSIPASEQPRPVQVGTMQHCVVIRAPQTTDSSGNFSGIAINIAETIREHYKASGQSITSATHLLVAGWVDLFSQPILKAALLMAEVRRAANLGKFDLPPQISLKEPSLINLALALGAAIEHGRLLLAIGLQINAPVQPLESFLADPVLFEQLGMPVVDCAKRIGLRYAIHPQKKKEQSAKNPMSDGRDWSTVPFSVQEIAGILKCRPEMSAIEALVPDGCIYSPTRKKHYVCYDDLNATHADQFRKIENERTKK